ncbi:hypothetical protein SAMN05660666_01008 [Novosphingobium aromaticivorans]|nr:hypothetical protein [Novosphingobium aromaticivorans]SCY19999.1 hypothetical protein SAMN05660666_01008 [Novosphingobium aromaticivorans]
MFDHLFTVWGTLSLDGLIFVQNALIILGIAGVIGAILYVGRKS